MRLVKVKRRWLLRLFGWQTFPAYVVAAPKLWLHWLTRGALLRILYRTAERK